MDKILVVTDMPDKHGNVLAGSGGIEWTKLLNEVGLDRAEDVEIKCIMPTHDPKGNDLLKINKKDPNGYDIGGLRVHKDVVFHIGQFFKGLDENPNRLIFGLGAIPILAFTGSISVKQQRGSMYTSRYGKFIGTHHPDTFLKMWEWRYVSRFDYIRGLKYRDASFPEPQYDFTIDAEYGETVDWLEGLLSSLEAITTVESGGLHRKLHVACDIETFRRQQISVCGLAVSKTKAIAIPFIDFSARDYCRWSLDEETTLVSLIKQILTHPNVEVSGQNFHYDTMYFARTWGLLPRHDLDCMHMMHSCWPGEMEKSLAFLSSVLCEYHMYWKDEGKEIHDKVKTPEDQIRYLTYNAKDCVTTWESAEALRDILNGKGLWDVWVFQQQMTYPLAKVMMRGVNYDTERQVQLRFQFSELLRHYEALFERIVPSNRYFPNAKKGSSPWYRSPTKLKTLLYEILGCEVQRDKKTKRPTTADAAIQTLYNKEPVLAPLLKKLLEYRSINVFVSTFLSPSVDTATGRMHTFYNLSGAETFRLSSKKDVYDTGANLQNIPKGDEK